MDHSGGFRSILSYLLEYLMMAVAASHLQNIHSIESTEIKIAYATVYYRRTLRHRHHEQTGREVVFLYKFREGLGSVSAVGSGRFTLVEKTTC